ncbi:MAG: lipid-A-disaccharide synthase [Candidatus Omnitrophica bacterium]|nr:lipid-A-disaccharide synthase [Candidatus Omnitrophota bacterium]
MERIYPKIMLVCGEESGDMRAAALVNAIKAEIPGASFSGIGGERCRQAGVDLIADISHLSVIGFTEVIRHYDRIKRVFDLAVNHARREHPDAVILVDYPGFNLRLAKQLKPLGIRIIYYVSPQVWAWKASRVKLIKKIVDRMIVLFPFEKDFYARYGYEADFVGHPLVDEVRADISAAQFRQKIGFEEKDRIIGLLPGSREREIARHLPAMLKAAELIRQEKPKTQFLLLRSKNLPDATFSLYLQSWKNTPDSRLVVTDNYYNALNACDACIVSSGTATLETALMEKPMVVVYRTSWPTYSIAKLVIKIPYIALANIVAGKKVADELLQQNASPDKIAAAMLPFLRDQERLKTAARELRAVRAKLGATGASQRAAKVVISELAR